MPNQERLINDFCDLVRIDSPSGEEWDVALHVSDRLSKLGFQVARDEHGNVIAREDGDNPLLLSAHMDTVDPGRSIRPQVVGERITSDGSTILGGDCKAGVAAILEALQTVHEDSRARRPVQVVFTRGEEIGLVGASNLDFSMITSTEAVVFDGNGPVNSITGGSPTYMAFDIDIKGRGAHAGGTPGEDPEYHRFHRVGGGFLSVDVDWVGDRPRIVLRHRDVSGRVVYEVERLGP